VSRRSGRSRPSQERSLTDDIPKPKPPREPGPLDGGSANCRGRGRLMNPLSLGLHPALTTGSAHWGTRRGPSMHTASPWIAFAVGLITACAPARVVTTPAPVPVAKSPIRYALRSDPFRFTAGRALRCWGARRPLGRGPDPDRLDRTAPGADRPARERRTRRADRRGHRPRTRRAVRGPI
jgi:hypothetical protein